VLIQLAQTQRIQLVLADVVEQDINQVILRKAALDIASTLQANYAGWMRRARVERHPPPDSATIQQHWSSILPALRTGLRIATPRDYLAPVGG
jgi:hypothetical protein